MHMGGADDRSDRDHGQRRRRPPAGSEAGAGRRDRGHDGVGNACDNCVNVANTTQVDADGDALTRETQVRVTTQLAIAYNNLNDHPKAVTLLKETLTLQELFERNAGYYQELAVFIKAGEMKLQELRDKRAVRVPALSEDLGVSEITIRRDRRTSARPVRQSTCFHRMPSSSSCMQMALCRVVTSPWESASETSRYRISPRQSQPSSSEFAKLPNPDRKSVV